jgi:hypothetical protein
VPLQWLRGHHIFRGSPHSSISTGLRQNGGSDLARQMILWITSHTQLWTAVNHELNKFEPLGFTWH